MQTWTSQRILSLSSFANVKQLARLDAVMVHQLLRRLRVSAYLPGGSRPRCLTSVKTSRCLRAPPAPCTRNFASQSPSPSPSPSQPQPQTVAPSTPPVQLRDYQLECIQSVVSAFKSGHKRVGVSLATGGGKTVGGFLLWYHFILGIPLLLFHR